MGFFVVHFTLGHETSFSLCSMGEVITQTFSFSFLEQRQSPLESISKKNSTYYSEKTFSHRTCNKAVLDHPKHR